MAVTPSDKVETVMHGDVVTVGPGASLRDAAEALVDEEVGALVVTETGQVTGILSERDIVRALAEGADPDGTSVSEVMTEGPLCADPEDTISVAAERMIRAGIRHMPVLGEGNPIGMISVRDLLGVLSDAALR